MERKKPKIKKRFFKIRRVSLIIIVILMSLFATLFSISYLQSRGYNLVRIRFDPDYTFTENTSLFIVYIADSEFIEIVSPTDPPIIREGAILGGGVNGQAVALTQEDFIQTYNQKILYTIHIEIILVLIQLLNTTGGGSTLLCASNPISATKSQTIEITGTNAIARTISINIIQTLFWIETWV